MTHTRRNFLATTAAAGTITLLPFALRAATETGDVYCICGVDGDNCGGDRPDRQAGAIEIVGSWQ